MSTPGATARAWTETRAKLVRVGALPPRSRLTSLRQDPCPPSGNQGTRGWKGPQRSSNLLVPTLIREEETEKPRVEQCFSHGHRAVPSAPSLSSCHLWSGSGVWPVPSVLSLARLEGGDVGPRHSRKPSSAQQEGPMWIWDLLSLATSSAPIMLSCSILAAILTGSPPPTPGLARVCGGGWG